MTYVFDLFQAWIEQKKSIVGQEIFIFFIFKDVFSWKTRHDYRLRKLFS